MPDGDSRLAVESDGRYAAAALIPDPAVSGMSHAGQEPELLPGIGQKRHLAETGEEDAYVDGENARGPVGHVRARAGSSDAQTVMQRVHDRQKSEQEQRDSAVDQPGQDLRLDPDHIAIGPVAEVTVDLPVTAQADPITPSKAKT